LSNGHGTKQTLRKDKDSANAYWYPTAVEWILFSYPTLRAF